MLRRHVEQTPRHHPSSGEASPTVVPIGAPEAGPLGKRRYLNRELSWLDFNERVLELAARDSLPLLERTKFLAIFSNNLDEFFQVRVGGVKMQLEAGLPLGGPEEVGPRERLEAICERVRFILAKRAPIFSDTCGISRRPESVFRTGTISTPRIGPFSRRRSRSASCRSYRKARRVEERWTVTNRLKHEPFTWRCPRR